jgi:hypothetical protein
MATTTNYGWTTPNDTDLVKDGASAIRTLGTSIDTTTKALNPSTTLGDIEYRSSTANTNTRLGIGTTGQVLTVSGGVPAWASPAGGGKVLQVVMGSTTTKATSTSSTFIDTNLTASITPSATTSKVLVIVSQNGIYDSISDGGTGLKLFRGATEIALIGERIGRDNALNTVSATGSIAYLDSPSTTSSTTYKTQFNSQQGVSQVQVQQANELSTIILMEIGV